MTFWKWKWRKVSKHFQNQQLKSRKIEQKHFMKKNQMKSDTFCSQPPQLRTEGEGKSFCSQLEPTLGAAILTHQQSRKGYHYVVHIMTLMNEIHRNQINVQQLIILLDTIKRVIFLQQFVFSVKPQQYLMKWLCVYISTHSTQCSHGPLKPVIQLFLFFP